MSLRTVNLNLLPVLQVLLRERNLTRSGQLLGLTQSALSMALGRLRQTLDDPLLVREGRQMVLTIKAQEMIPLVDDLCARLEGLFPPTGFDPAVDQGKFVIASSDYGFQLIATRLARAMEEAAPELVIHFVDVPHTDLEPHAGEVDFFILPKQIMASGRFPNMRFEPLLTDHFVAIASQDTARRYRAGQAIDRYAIYYPGLASIKTEELGFLNGWDATTGRIVAQVQHFNLLPSFVLESHCAAIIPSALAGPLCAHHLFEIVEGLGTTGEPMDMVLAWYSIETAHPRSRWFRSLLLGLFQD